ncbi:hypothetical protein ScPMuIL_008399 [Solemya velum]
MVRTKADGCAATRKVVASRAPRKALGGGGGNSGSSSTPESPAGNKYAGGNPVCPRPTPDWQKGISHFFTGGKPIGNKDSNSDKEVTPSSTASGASGDSAEPGPSASNEYESMESEN